MNRTRALKIQLESWMLEEDFQQYIELYNIEATTSAAERGETPVIWLDTHDEGIFTAAGRPMVILANLRLWFDDGTQEIRINESNYTDYNSSGFYKNRSGKYDEFDEMI